LYYAVTGKVPFPGGTAGIKAKRILEERPLHPRQFSPDIREEFVEIIADMMEIDPSRRASSAAEVAARLEPDERTRVALAARSREVRTVRVARGIAAGQNALVSEKRLVRGRVAAMARLAADARPSVRGHLPIAGMLGQRIRLKIGDVAIGTGARLSP
jgi:hypothetical protein